HPTGFRFPHSFPTRRSSDLLFQASMENSDPTIAAPITGRMARVKLPAGQNAGPKFAASAVALRPIASPSRINTARDAVLIAVRDVWMIAAVRTPRTLIQVKRSTEAIAKTRCGDNPTAIGPLPRLIVVPRKTSGVSEGMNTDVNRASATATAAMVPVWI